jgi:hypothetical protein
LTLEGRPDPVTPGILYQIYTDIWLLRNDWNSSLDIETKKHLLERFAARAARDAEYSLHYEAIADLVAEWNTGSRSVDTQQVDAELRTASFLVRNGTGFYRFSHRSFQEFFFAKHLLAEAVAGRLATWEAGFFRTEIYRFIRDLLPNDPNAAGTLVSWLGDEASPINARINAAKCVAALRDPAVADAALRAVRATHDSRLLLYLATALGSQPEPRVEAVLKDLVERCSHLVRANALVALARIGTEATIDFVMSILQQSSQDSASTGSSALWPFYSAARGIRHPQLARAILRTVPNVRSGHWAKVAGSCLDLCRLHPSPEADAFCERVLQKPRSNRLMARAFGALSHERRLTRLPDVLARLVSREDRRRPSVDELIDSLRGLARPEVADVLIRIVEEDAEHHPQVAAAAYEILSAEYPHRLQSTGQAWLDRGQPYFLRIRRAREQAQRMGREALPMLREMLAPGERVAIKRAALEMIFEYDPRSLAGIVEEMWGREPATLVKRFALELLRRVDRPAAVAIMLRHGLRDSRVGTRIAVCQILGVESAEEVTEALLERLAVDYSPWVRRQALRSLITPGRAVNRERVLAASSDEADAAVVALRDQLMGK